MSKKRLLLIIDEEEPRYLDVETVELAYNAYEKCDMAIVISSVIEEKDPDTILPMPSPVGIEMESKFSDPALISNIEPAQLLLDSLRTAHKIIILPEVDSKQYAVTNTKNVLIMTKYYSWEAVESQRLAIQELAASEKCALDNPDHVLFINNAPSFRFNADGSQFRAQEVITIYARTVKDVAEVIASEQPALQESTEPGLTNEELELFDIFNELFKHNAARAKKLVGISISPGSKDNAEDVYFFVTQAMLATGNKISEATVLNILNKIIQETQKALG